MSSQSISDSRTVWLLARLALRRQINMWQSARWRRRKRAGSISGAGAESARSATPAKQKRLSVFSAFILLLMLFNGFNIDSNVLRSLSATAGNLAARTDGIPVDGFTAARLREADDGLRRASEISDPAQRAQYVGMWNRRVEEIFLTEVRREGLSEDEESSRLLRMRAVFDSKGAAGFTSQPVENYWVSRDTWPKDARSSAVFLRSLSLIMLLWAAFMVFAALGLYNKNLGEVEWNFEWLYSFPASARALFTSKLFVYAFFNPAAWFFFFPFPVLVFVSAGYGITALFAGLAVMIYLALLTGALCTFSEVALRKFLSLGQLKNIQGLSTVIGTISLLLAFAAGLSKPLGGFLVARAASMPKALAWNPFSLPLILGSPSTSSSEAWTVIAIMITLCLAICSLALWGSEWLTRDGLVIAGGPYQGSRKIGARAKPATRISKDRPQRAWFRGVAANEILLLARDRNLLVQVLVVPLLVPTFYLLVNAGTVSAIKGNFRNAALVAFGVGAYSLISSAMPILNREGNTLWQLLTFPQSLSGILAKKAAVLAALAIFYGGVVLLLAAHFSSGLHASSWIFVFLALYGIAIYAFIASGIGILATNVVETERRARFRTDMVYLYMMLAAMYANTFYSPSVWAKIAQLVFSTLLAVALWQKVDDAAPYLLDPVAQPPRVLSLADGLIAGLAFFVVQGLLFLLIDVFVKSPAAAKTTGAYTLSGLIIATAALLTFWRQGVPDLWRKIGVLRTGKTKPQTIARDIVFAAALGVLAAVGAILYVHVLGFFPMGQIWKQDAQLNSFLARADRSLWLCLLAIVAAPLFEEFLFRGLIFRGLRRKTGPVLAVLGSAALFALVHPPIAVLPVFGLGIAAAVSFQRSGFLLAPVLTHAVYNTIVIFLNKP